MYVEGLRVIDQVKNTARVEFLRTFCHHDIWLTIPSIPSGNENCLVNGDYLLRLPSIGVF